MTTFIGRDAPRPGEVTVRIYTDAGAVLGEVISPDGVAGSGTAAERDHDGALGVHQAIMSAVELSARHGGRVGVVDEEELWRPEWGTLAKDSG